MGTARVTSRIAAAALVATSVTGFGTVAAPTALAAAGSFVQPAPLLVLDGQVDGLVPHPASPYPSTLTVSGLPNGVTDVNLTLSGYTHTFPDDVDMMLVGPAGQRAMVMSDVGSLAIGDPGAANVSLVFDDQAAAALPDNGPLTGGTFRPSNYLDIEPFLPLDPFPGGPDPTGVGSALATFNGTNPNGAWQLWVVDDETGDEGVFAGGWSLQIATADVPAAPVITEPRSGALSRLTTVVSGTAPAGTTVRLFDKGVQVPATVAATAAGWTFALIGLADGAHSFTATASDALNTSAPSPAVTLTVDTVSPTVTATAPRAGARRVKPAANVTVRFREPVRAGTLSAATVFLVRNGTTKRIPAKVTYNAVTRTATLNPARQLSRRTAYLATVTTRVLDLAGNAFDGVATRAGSQAKLWKFTTR